MSPALDSHSLCLQAGVGALDGGLWLFIAHLVWVVALGPGFLELSWTTGCSPYHYLFSGSRDGGLQEKGCGWLLGGHLVSSPGHSRRLGGVEGED